MLGYCSSAMPISAFQLAGRGPFSPVPSLERATPRRLPLS